MNFDCINKVICGNAVDVMADMPAESVNCIITSPPYWGLRAYKTEPQNWGNWRGELGLEPTIELYIEHLMMVFDQAKRVLRNDGVCFVNIGDTYGGSATQRSSGGRQGFAADKDNGIQVIRPNTMPKSLCNIPEKFCLAMEQSGWIKRCNIIWVKGLSFCDTYSGSCMPDSAKDRPNKNGFEWVYMFTKSKKYWYEPQFEEAQELNVERPRMGQGNQTIYNQKRGNSKVGGFREVPLGQTQHTGKNKTRNEFMSPLGRTIRNVWAINPQPFPDAHFATFPEKLVEPMIKMGCPEFVCKKCGKAREKIYKTKGGYIGQNWNTTKPGIVMGNRALREEYNKTEIGYTDCGCNAGWRPGICLDMFWWLWHCWQSSCSIKTGLYSHRIAA